MALPIERKPLTEADFERSKGEVEQGLERHKRTYSEVDLSARFPQQPKNIDGQRRDHYLRQKLVEIQNGTRPRRNSAYSFPIGSLKGKTIEQCKKELRSLAPKKVSKLSSLVSFFADVCKENPIKALLFIIGIAVLAASIHWSLTVLVIIGFSLLVVSPTPIITKIEDLGRRFHLLPQAPLCLREDPNRPPRKPRTKV